MIPALIILAETIRDAVPHVATTGRNYYPGPVPLSQGKTSRQSSISGAQPCC